MNKKERGRVFIVDPSLKDFQGHHFSLTKNASLSAQQHGFDVTWLCSRDFKIKAGMDLDDITILPTFTNSMYDAYKKTSKLKTYGAVALELAEEIIETLRAEKVTKYDRVLFHTADGLTYLTLPKILGVLKSRTPIIHVCTPYDPVGVMPNRERPEVIYNTIQQLKKDGFVNQRVFFYGENDLLSKHLSKLWDISVHTLNLPTNQNNETFSTSELIQFRREALGVKPKVFICCYLGSARLEKGYHQLPYIVSRVFQLGAPDVQIHFAIQSSPQIIGYNQTIKNAILKMKKLPRKQVTLIEHVLTNREYSLLLHASDLILLPYELDKYRVRGSGIVSEAIELGKIVVGTKGTYPGFMGERYSGGSAEKPVGFSKKILEIHEDRHNYVMKARTKAVEFNAAYNCNAYFKRCLIAEGELTA